jgi:hypothetical protein
VLRAKLVASLLAVLLVGCGGQDVIHLALRLRAADARPLVSGALVALWIADRQARDSTTYDSFRLTEAYGSDRAVETEFGLHGGGAYDLHVLVDGPDGRWYATRCYTIGGDRTSEVLLAGPLDRTNDDDGDSWPTLDDCLDPGGVPCADPCPSVRSDDCNDRDSDIHPLEPEICGDQIDQDCSGADAVCSDDENGP